MPLTASIQSLRGPRRPCSAFKKSRRKREPSSILLPEQEHEAVCSVCSTSSLAHSSLTRPPRKRFRNISQQAPRRAATASHVSSSSPIAFITDYNWGDATELTFWEEVSLQLQRRRRGRRRFAGFSRMDALAQPLLPMPPLHSPFSRRAESPGVPRRCLDPPTTERERREERGRDAADDAPMSDRRRRENLSTL